MALPKTYNESVGELRSFFGFRLEPLVFILAPLNPRLIPVVNEVLRPPDRLH